MAKKYNGLKGRKIVMFFCLIATMIVIFVAGSILIAQIGEKETRDLISSAWNSIIAFATTGGMVLINAIAQHNPQVSDSDEKTDTKNGES